MPDLTDIFIRTENVVAREIVDELLLVPISGDLADLERVFVLDSVGGLIWSQFDGSQSLNAILLKIISQYEVDKQTAENDILELVQDLMDVELVKKNDE